MVSQYIAGALRCYLMIYDENYFTKHCLNFMEKNVTVFFFYLKRFEFKENLSSFQALLKKDVKFANFITNPTIQNTAKKGLHFNSSLLNNLLVKRNKITNHNLECK